MGVGKAVVTNVKPHKDAPRLSEVRTARTKGDVSGLQGPVLGLRILVLIQPLLSITSTQLRLLENKSNERFRRSSNSR